MSAHTAPRSEDASHDRRVELRVSREGGRTILWLDGEHDASTVTRDVDALALAISLHDDDVVVDLSGAEFIGLATVDLFLRGRDYLLGGARRLTLRAPSRNAVRLIEWGGLGALIAW